MVADAAETRQLTRAERSEFDRTGLVILRNVLSRPSLDRLTSASDRLIADPSMPGRQQQAHGVWDSIRNCVAKSADIRHLISHPRVLSAVVQLMGTNLKITTSHVIYRNPDLPGVTSLERVPPWHRDIAHVSQDLGFANTPRLQIKAAYCLTDLKSANSGGTMFLLGSHVLGRRPAIPQEGDPPGAVEPRLEAGDCVLFENRVMHAGARNHSARIRKSIMIAYGFRWLAPADYRRQPVEVRADMTDVERFLVGESIAPGSGFTVGGSSNPLDKFRD
jgi:ectoine hydroxylase-related dioxygenase (phytanoyl-CoA dioxygenase family)